MSFRDSSSNDLEYAYLAPGGAWAFETPDSGGNVGTYASLGVYAGEVHVSYRDESNTNFKYARRDASGAWAVETVDSTGDNGSPTSLALDGSGGVHVAYRYVSGSDLKYAYRSPAGSWSCCTTVDATGDTGRTPAIAVDAAGAVHVVCRATLADDVTNDLKHAWLPPGGFWSVETTHAGGDLGYNPAVAADPSGGGLWAVYRDSTPEDLLFAFLCP